MTDLLRLLTTDDFVRVIGLLVPSSSLRLVLQRNPLVQEIAGAVRTGTVTEQNVRSFVSSELSTLRRGKPLEHDLALAALAVAVEGSPAGYAQDLLSELAALSIVEMQESIRMARECLRHRTAALTFEKTLTVSAAPTPMRTTYFVYRDSPQGSSSNTFVERRSLEHGNAAA